MNGLFFSFFFNPNFFLDESFFYLDEINERFFDNNLSLFYISLVIFDDFFGLNQNVALLINVFYRQRGKH